MNYDVDSVLIFMYVISMALAIAEQYMPRRQIESGMFFFCIGLICITALRPPANTIDTTMYTDVFHSAPTFSWFLSGDQTLFDLPIEWGYLLLNLIIGNLIDEHVVLFFFVSAISIGVYFSTFHRYSPYPALSLFLYMTLLFVFREYSQIRQGVACAISLYSMQFIYERKTKEFFCSVFIAASFHLSAIFITLFYFINKISWTKSKVLLSIIVAGGFIEIHWIYHAMELLGDSGLLYYRIAKYQGDMVAQQNVTLVKYVVYTMILLFLGLTSWGNRKSGEWSNLLLGILVGGVLVQGILFEFRELADRISSLYYVVLFLLIPTYLQQTKYRMVLLFILLSALPFYFIRTLAWIKDPLQ